MTVDDGADFSRRAGASGTAHERLDPVRVRELLEEDEEAPAWEPSGDPITLDRLALVVLADTDYRTRGEADVFGPFASQDEAERYCRLIPNEPHLGDGGYPPTVYVLTIADLIDPAAAWWLEPDGDD
jgi:hypothetical protein